MLPAQKDKIFIEVISEGPHCIPCEYAIKSVREIAPEFEGVIEWSVVLLKEREGANRYLELAQKLGKNPPIPSILINERVAFERIPGPQLLRTTIERVLEGKEMESQNEETF
ncbi:MAG: hypothetical protein FJ115_06490 [Deltaproteobacteria bacterium]|nr:hypothetical protein [Deltaproteobacteria bacterium]MBM4323189.1 hypothetical protein [Deltaproteobacteria bacterium]MBM4347495.1 hypothetical protein [Deltaproteobacteria bacterium]